MITHAFDEERTKVEIEKGTSREDDNKPWIWQHRNAASREYNYIKEPSAEPPQTTTTTDTPAPVVDTPPPAVTTTTTTGSETTQDETTDGPAPTEGQRRFLGWVRDMLGL